jgi:hypothetical protein
VCCGELGVGEVGRVHDDPGVGLDLGLDLSLTPGAGH